MTHCGEPQERVDSPLYSPSVNSLVRRLLLDSNFIPMDSKKFLDSPSKNESGIEKSLKINRSRDLIFDGESDYVVEIRKFKLFRIHGNKV